MTSARSDFIHLFVVCLCKMLVGSLALGLPATPAATIAAANAQSAGDWPQFRGPRRDGLSTDSGLLRQWPRNGPKLLWEAKGAGRGYASLAIASGKIFTLGDDRKHEHAICLDEATGKQLWKIKLGPVWEGVKEESWQSPRSTPTIDGELLHVMTPHGDLVCLDSAAGAERWRKNMQDLGGKKDDSYGYSESVLIDGEKVICTPGGPKATMVALDKKTGKQVWTAAVPDDRGAGHASIVLAEIGKTRIYVQMTGGGAVGVRASDGKVLWTYPIAKTTAVCPTPIVRGDLVFLAAGYRTGGGALLRQVSTPDGGITVEEVYPLNLELRNKHGGVVLVGDFLYGDTHDLGILWCAELMTGKQRWKKRGSGTNSLSLTVADGLFYIRYGSGKMVLAQVSPEDYKEISSFTIPHSADPDRPSWAYPVVTGGKLFLREEDYVLCYDIRAR